MGENKFTKRARLMPEQAHLFKILLTFSSVLQVKELCFCCGFYAHVKVPVTIIEANWPSLRGFPREIFHSPGLGLQLHRFKSESLLRFKEDCFPHDRTHRAQVKKEKRKSPNYQFTRKKRTLSVSLVLHDLDIFP